MSTYEGSIKTGHPVAGIVLGILGIVIAAALTLLFGVIAGGVAALLGIGALLLGIGARKGGRGGLGGIITGAAALVMAMVMTLTSVGLLKEMHKAALETGKAPIFAESLETPYLGVFGAFAKLADHPEKVNALTREMDALKEYTRNTASGTSAQADPS